MPCRRGFLPVNALRCFASTDDDIAAGDGGETAVRDLHYAIDPLVRD